MTFQMMSELEVELSLKSDHELRLEREEDAARRRKAGEEGVAAEMGDLSAAAAANAMKTAKDREDEWAKEKKQFQVGNDICVLVTTRPL